MVKPVLNSESVIPLYYQLKEIIRERVDSGEWVPGDQVPSEPELAKQFGISRATVRRAFSDLTLEGVLYRRQGRGTFVSYPKIEQDLTRFYSFSREMTAKGLKPSDRIISLRATTSSRRISLDLGLSEGEKVYELHRLRLVDNEPFILERSWLPVDTFAELSVERLNGRTLYGLMEEQYGIIPVRAVEYFEPVLINEYEARMLEVREGAPALLLKRIAYTNSGKPIEICKGIVRGDRCRYYVSLP